MISISATMWSMIEVIAAIEKEIEDLQRKARRSTEKSQGRSHGNVQG